MPLGHPTDQEFILYEDGTTYWLGTGSYNNVTLQTSAALKGINQWNAGGNIPPGSYYAGLLFPQPRHITAFSLCWVDDDYTNRGPLYIQTSTDATNLSNGNWVQQYDRDALATNWRVPYGSPVNIQKLRTPWIVDWQNIVAIRILTATNGYDGVSEIHLWGSYARPGLAFWDVTLDQVMTGANLDFGDVAQGSVTNRQFRIKNNYSQTANNIVVTAPAGSIGDVLNTLQFSDGGAYANSITIPTIAPGAISPIITARRTVSPTAALQIGCARVTATAGSWT